MKSLGNVLGYLADPLNPLSSTYFQAFGNCVYFGFPVFISLPKLIGLDGKTYKLDWRKH